MLNPQIWMKRIKKFYFLPHILSGASSSRRIGCDKKISLDLRHKPRISPSVSWTFLPGREPRTEKKRNKNFLIWINDTFHHDFRVQACSFKIFLSFFRIKFGKWHKIIKLLLYTQFVNKRCHVAFTKRIIPP